MSAGRDSVLIERFIGAALVFAGCCLARHAFEMADGAVLGCGAGTMWLGSLAVFDSILPED